MGIQTPLQCTFHIIVSLQDDEPVVEVAASSADIAHNVTPITWTPTTDAERGKVKFRDAQL